MRQGGQIIDDQKFPLCDGPFVDRAGKVRDAILRRISADSAIFNVRAVLQHEDPLPLTCGKAEEQIRLSEEGAEFLL